MTGIDPERLERRLRWAAEQLGLSLQASPEEVRAAWLRRLPEEEFVPPTEERWALEALLHQQGDGYWQARVDEAAAAAEEERLRTEVEAFADRFWDLPIEERRRRWEELANRCAFAPTLRARLKLLEAGLAVDPHVSHNDERVMKLAEQVRELFVLRPGRRACARQDYLQRMEEEGWRRACGAPPMIIAHPTTEQDFILAQARASGQSPRKIIRRLLQGRMEWQAIVHSLRGACPQLASLGNDLLEKIATARRSTKRPPQKLPTQQNENNVARPTPLGCIWLIACLILGILKGVACNDRSNRSRPPSYREPEQLSPEKLQLSPELRKALIGDVENEPEKGKSGEKAGKADGKSP